MRIPRPSLLLVAALSCPLNGLTGVAAQSSSAASVATSTVADTSAPTSTLTAADLPASLSGLPQCGIDCALSALPTYCGSLTNIACMCTSDTARAALLGCVQAGCATIDALAVARIDAETCAAATSTTASNATETTSSTSATTTTSKRRVKLDDLGLQIPAFLATGMRLWVRWRMLGRWEADDWIMVLGWPVFTVFVVLGQYGSALGFGRNAWEIPPEEITMALKLYFICQALYVVLLTVTKLSVLLFLLRVFPLRTFRMFAWSVVAFVATSGTVFFFLLIFQCWPIEYNWEGWKAAPGQEMAHKCMNLNALTITQAVFTIVQDIIILALPMPLVWRLNTSWRNKAAITVLFSVGVFILATSCIRLGYMINYAFSTNPTKDNAKVMLWSGLEVSMSVLVTSMPAISAYLGTRFPRFFGRTIANSRNTPGSGGRGHSSAKKTFGSASEARETKESKIRRHRKHHGDEFSLFRDEEEDGSGGDSWLELGDRAQADARAEAGRGGVVMVEKDIIHEEESLSSQPTGENVPPSGPRSLDPTRIRVHTTMTTSIRGPSKMG